tara:strand:- start:1422 stop:1781 length:360 start_codon:yes stop_codon:yes gene_type:complete
MPNSLTNLPPELQARIAGIISQGQAHSREQDMPGVFQPPVVANPNPAPLAVKQPSLMDHIVALRQEVNLLSQQMQATAQVTEAVGNAVGQLYEMFQVQTQPSSYSATFQTQTPSNTDEF